MQNHKSEKISFKEEMEELRHQLFEARETIEAIRLGMIDAIVVESDTGNALYTLKSADLAYRVFIEQMTEGALTINNEGLILYCNSQFAEMVQFPLNNIIGSSLFDFISPEDLDVFRNILETSWTAPAKTELMLKAGNDKTPVQISLAALRLETTTALSVIVNNLSAQKKAQKELENANTQLGKINRDLEVSNRDLQQFASVASHDLQEPLRKIQVFSKLLLEKYNQDLTAEGKKYIGKIIESAGRMKSLVVDVLNYSKLSAREQEIKQVNIREVLGELLEDFELIIQEKKAEIRIADLPVLDANRGQIRQVLQNVISNALKFAKKGMPPVIDIHSRRLASKSFESPEKKDGPYCLISIRDEGIGFDKKYGKHIFELFERLHSKDAYEGTGIGLAITKKIVEKHNGLVAARSNPGQGAEFLLLLPLKQE
ncbi:sensor histidine kinase [Pollutibacter soli]|uniref:sensor histidine kinase n=1 Tax=Pollutibacter soli TaxID=3034157 RepID=UPI0030134CC8